MCELYDYLSTTGVGWLRRWSRLHCNTSGSTWWLGALALAARNQGIRNIEGRFILLGVDFDSGLYVCVVDGLLNIFHFGAEHGTDEVFIA